MIFIGVSKACLASLFGYSLASATVNAALQVRDAPDVGVSVSKIIAQAPC